MLSTAKSAPANTSPATQLVTPSAATVANGPPPVKPLQTAKKPSQPGGITAVVDGDDNKGPGMGSVAAAAAALEKPKPKEVEKRISTMTEAQIMEKMRSVVDSGDPKLMYSKIKKIGQGYVICRPWFCDVIYPTGASFFLQCLWACICRQDTCIRKEGCD
jgi:protein-serine/threonine kinase